MDPSAVDQSMITSFLAIFMGVGLIITIAVWLLLGFSFYKMFSKANQPNPWLAFIPLANMWPYMWTIKKSAWNILWMIIPIVNIVFAIIWFVRLLKAFGQNPLWALLFIGTIIPFVNYLAGAAMIVLYCYMGFSSKVQYVPNFDQKPAAPSTGATA